MEGENLSKSKRRKIKVDMSVPLNLKLNEVMKTKVTREFKNNLEKISSTDRNTDRENREKTVTKK